MKILKILAPIVAMVLTLSVSSAFAAGDAEKGKKGIKKCTACHSLEEGKKKGSGPGLYGVVGRQAGTLAGYKYSKDMVEAGKGGLKWTEENLVAFLEDPKKFIGTTLKKGKGKIKMSPKYKKQELRENIAAYLATLAPAPKK